MIGTKILEERESKFNGHLRVVKSVGLGTYIQANGLTQSGGIVESIWKSTLRKVHHSLPTVHRSLILGLGGGTVAKLVRKFWPDAKITGIDIDPIMIELGKKYLGLDQAGIEVKIGDAAQYAKYKILNTEYDLVMVDLYQGDQFPKKFESENYIHLVRSLLSRGGIVVFNRLYFGDKRPEAVKFGLKLQKVFSRVEYYYPEANLMFICHARKANI